MALRMTWGGPKSTRERTRDDFASIPAYRTDGCHVASVNQAGGTWHLDVLAPLTPNERTELVELARVLNDGRLVTNDRPHGVCSKCLHSHDAAPPATDAATGDRVCEACAAHLHGEKRA